MICNLIMYHKCFTCNSIFNKLNLFSGGTTVLSSVNEIPFAYQQLLDAAMLHPSAPVHGTNFNINRVSVPSAPGAPPGSLLGCWHNVGVPTLPSSLPQPMDEVSGESQNLVTFFEFQIFILKF